MEKIYFQSQSVCGEEIELCVLEIDSNTIEIIVSNLDFKENRNNARKHLLFYFSALLLSGMLAFFKLIILHIFLIVLILFRFYCFSNLVQFGKLFKFNCIRCEPKKIVNFLEKLTVTKDFGVQLLTTYSIGRKKSIFIQFAYIHEVVITEVIQNVRL